MVQNVISQGEIFDTSYAYFEQSLYAIFELTASSTDCFVWSSLAIF